MVDETVPGGAGAQQGTGSDLPAAFMTWRRTANIKRMPGMILMPRWTAEHEPWVQAAIAEHLPTTSVHRTLCGSRAGAGAFASLVGAALMPRGHRGRLASVSFWR